MGAELLFWPALLAYGEAAVAYAGSLRRARLERLATWGVRLGWLAQTALLVAQVVREEAFPWDTWAGSLNLFVWLVVGAYLIWGCTGRYRLLGLGVMPVAAALFVLARLGGGTGENAAGEYGTLFLVLHVGAVLVAFAGFTIAAALAALYLWQEARLKRRPAEVLRLRMPGLMTLETVAARPVLVALPALTLAIAAGLLRLADDGGRPDALMAATVLTWVVYGAFVFAHYGWGLRGKRGAYVLLAGFSLVVLSRLILSIGHFG